jgi:hypothetical protein
MTIREYIAARRSSMFKWSFAWFVLVLITAALLDTFVKGAPNMFFVIVIGWLIAMVAVRVIVNRTKCPRCGTSLRLFNDSANTCAGCGVSLDEPMP